MLSWKKIEFECFYKLFDFIESEPRFAEVAHDADSNGEQAWRVLHKFKSSFLRSVKVLSSVCP